MSIDDGHRIRVLGVEKFEHTEQLAEACGSFVKKNDEFRKLMSGIVEVLELNTSRIESEKLRAIGMRNKVLGERENREQTRRKMLALVAEKKAELERCQKERKSLAQVEAEQRALLEKYWLSLD